MELRGLGRSIFLIFMHVFCWMRMGIILSAVAMCRLLDLADICGPVVTSDGKARLISGCYRRRGGFGLMLHYFFRNRKVSFTSHNYAIQSCFPDLLPLEATCQTELPHDGPYLVATISSVEKRSVGVGHDDTEAKEGLHALNS